MGSKYKFNFLIKILIIIILLIAISFSFNNFNQESIENSQKFIIYEKGTYHFEQTNEIPKGTTIEIKPGVILKFDKDVSLITNGPIIAKGTKEQPIIFTSSNKENWGVIGIISPKNPYLIM